MTVLDSCGITMSKIRTTGVILVAAPALFLGASSIIAEGQVFDVVSIREVPRDAPVLMRDPHSTSVLPGGQFVDPRVTLRSMIVFAFHVPSPVQVTGVSGWVQEQQFSVSAKPAKGFP